MNLENTYANALYELACDENIDTEVLSDIKSISLIFSQNPEYVKILDSPNIKKTERLNIINEDFSGKINEICLNFLKIICENKDIRIFIKCADIYEDLYNKKHNIKTVNITTAHPISEVLENMLTEKISQKTGGKIIIKKHIDKSCIGGIIIDIDGIRTDASIRSGLNEIKEILKGSNI